ncbi:hypothetical protein CC77DRAFT_987358 [Alternaria alternata]|uniref:2EXR domain-containing protein n=1 Tax=Alternaria alternata TaxID=5599 RepID=A0A177DQY6_ALTAL|nr:hypothetical protein CC77DRAFT_987358 [Alternaria alternata]XP_051584432.1 uncharacterized protein J4E82_009613 [Alternaria postmessia]KAI5371729.1 hypothetical protein J4E82_009613 [Alternaria postmessia]OAG21778.1 hypothetical protein CC77DRAFT_987358 [Alternaria alternata]
MTSTFHPFPRLPLELQRQIWRCTVEPRTVEVRVEHWKPDRDPFLISSTPVPGPLQCCREHRPQGLYLIDKLDVTGIYGPSIERRYVWLNFDIDMVDIGNSYLSAFKPIASKIKRLKFERENSNEAWFNTEKRELKDFKNVEEIHVVCADGFDQWAFSMYDISWPCADDKILFLDPSEGQVANGMEFEGVCRQMLLDRRLELTGVAWHTSDEESDS